MNMHQMFHPDVMDAARDRMDSRQAEYMRAGYPQERLPFPERTRADFVGEHDRQGVCVCCGERTTIPAMMHVCRPCFNETEAERV